MNQPAQNRELSTQMRKTYPLHAQDKAPARVIDAIKGEIRKYLKRERRKKLPDGFDLWGFNCRIGTEQSVANIIPIADLIAAVDSHASDGATQVYVEILAFADRRHPREEPDILTS
jgi:hypothetical protein